MLGGTGYEYQWFPEQSGNYPLRSGFREMADESRPPRYPWQGSAALSLILVFLLQFGPAVINS